MPTVYVNIAFTIEISHKNNEFPREKNSNESLFSIRRILKAYILYFCITVVGILY